MRVQVGLRVRVRVMVTLGMRARLRVTVRVQTLEICMEAWYQTYVMSWGEDECLTFS